MPDAPLLPVNEGVPFPEEAATATESDPIAISAQYIQQWEEEDHTEVSLLRGRCRVVQGGMTLTAQQMVIWRSGDSDNASVTKLTVYLEGDARLEWPYRHETQHAMLLKLATQEHVTYTGRPPLTGVAAAEDPVYQRAIATRDAGDRQQLKPTQLIMPDPNAGPMLGPAVPIIEPQITRHVSINPRYLGQSFSANSRVSDSVPPELIITISGGVNIVVDNVPIVINNVTLLTTVDLTADNAVIWTDADEVGDAMQGFNLEPGTKFQVYLEGNIVVRQGLNEAKASHAFYDVSERRGLLMNAEVRAFVPELESFLRIRAQQVRQLSESSFHAQNAWFTTSQMGRPGYRVEASDVFLEERFDPSSQIDPITGQPDSSAMWVRSYNNRFYVEDVPVLYAPYLSTPVEDPQIPLRHLEAGYDQVFGLSVKSVFSLEGLFGLELPRGADWGLRLDGFSERGPAIGTLFDYDFMGNFMGSPAHYEGFGDFYYINDGGTDNLGQGRRSLAVPDDNRGRALWRNRIDFPYGTWLTAELGYVSDRNFREQYYEQEWDRDKDQETLLGLNHQYDNWTISGMGRVRLNDFEYQTDWLPRVDLTVLGEPLANTGLIWSSHSSVGYGAIQPAQAPSDPNDPFTPLVDPGGQPYFPNSDGVVAMTRHEIDLPLNVGPFNLVPYVLGEAAYWQEDITQDELARLYGSAGVRGSILFWNAWPDIRDPILGLNGLAHKMTFDFDYYYAEASEPLSSIAQYNEFDEDSQERFRTRFILLEFGGVLPAIYDPRFYAVRTGAGRSVTAPYHELVDDQQVLRMGWRHRWQTKVGPPDRPRIKDWMTLDFEASYFPDADRDNFGEDFGLLGGHYSWNVGERTTLLADAIYDVFNGGQEIWSLGILTQRSTRGSLYLGFRQVNVGPIDSQLAVASYSYAMSPKWASTFGTSFDIAEGRDRGQSLTITRIGEYALFHVGLGYDRSRNNFGFGISIEPRLGGYGSNSTQLSSLLGVPLGGKRP